MKVTTTRKTYDAVAKGEPLVIVRKGRRTTDTATVDVIDRDGELREINAWEHRACPVRERGIVTLRFKDGGKTRGRLAVMVTGITRDDEGRFVIRLERVGIKHRPIPADDRNFYLAPTAGYTSSASKAMRGGKDGREIDIAAADPVEASRVNRDIQIRQADKPSPIQKQVAEPVEPLTEEEKADRMDNISDELGGIAA